MEVLFNWSIVTVKEAVIKLGQFALKMTIKWEEIVAKDEGIVALHKHHLLCGCRRCEPPFNTYIKNMMKS
jgi:hypothetical protein